MDVINEVMQWALLLFILWSTLKDSSQIWDALNKISKII